MLGSAREVVRTYIVAVIVVGLASLLFVASLPAPQSTQWVLGLMLATAVFSVWKVDLNRAQSELSMGSAVVCVAALIEGGQAAAASAALGALLSTLLRRGPGESLPKPVWSRAQGRPFEFAPVLFNVAVGILSAAVAYKTMLIAQDWVRDADAHPLVRSAAGAMTFQSIYFLLNTAVVAGYLGLRDRSSAWMVWTRDFAWTWPSYLATASLAVAIQLVAARFSLGLISLLLLAPLYWVYVSYRLYSDRVALQVEKMDENMRHVSEMRDLHASVIASLAAAIDFKDRNTRSHISRVQMYAVTLAERAGLSGSDLEAVRIGALVHDIGKLGIPERILCKPGKLTPDEFRWMQKHVAIGVEILAPVPFPYPVKDIVLTHHERWDGLGYPQGLAGEAIPIGGRIMAIADVFDALTSNRPYRRAMGLDGALRLLRDGAGKQFDPSLVDLFTEILPEVHSRVEALTAQQAVSSSGIPEVGPARTERTDPTSRAVAAAEMVEALSATGPVEDVLSVIADHSLRLFPVDTVAIFLCRADGRLVADRVRGLYEDKLAALELGRGEGVSGWVAETLQAQVNAQASLDIARRFTPQEVMELSAATSVPLGSGGATLGVVTLYTSGYSVINEEHLRLLQLLSHHAAQALVQARQFEATRELVLFDDQTQLPNSRCLMHHLASLCAGPTAFGIVILGVEGFQQISETHGHVRADSLLSHLGEVLRREVRNQDMPCRYSGDEFVVVLLGADGEEARAFGSRLALQLRTEVETVASTPVVLNHGWAIRGADGNDSPRLLGAAFERLLEGRSERDAARGRLGVSGDSENRD